jgi:DNA (cytosine-5)-methyltransferase 1
MLDLGFEQEGFCVVRGPDVIWGGDIRTFHPPAGVFDGVIGGPPCQTFSPIGNVNRKRYGEDSVMPDMIPEFERCVEECKPGWWLMENSPNAYSHMTPCFRIEIENNWLGERQSRRRAFWSSLQLKIETPFWSEQNTERTVSSKGSVDWKGSRAREPKRTLADMCELQGLPPDWLDHQPWTMQAKRKMIGNGVPNRMARALAHAVREALDATRGLSIL